MRGAILPLPQYVSIALCLVKYKKTLPYLILPLRRFGTFYIERRFCRLNSIKIVRFIEFPQNQQIYQNFEFLLQRFASDIFIIVELSVF
jgi:hypothetical protein